MVKIRRLIVGISLIVSAGLIGTVSADCGYDPCAPQTDTKLCGIVCPQNCPPAGPIKPSCGLVIPGNGIWWECNLPVSTQDLTLGVQAVAPCNVLLCEPSTALMGEAVMDATSQLASFDLVATTPIQCDRVGAIVALHTAPHAFDITDCVQTKPGKCQPYGQVCAGVGSTEGNNHPDALCCPTNTNGANLTCNQVINTMGSLEIVGCCIDVNQPCDDKLSSGGCCTNPQLNGGGPATCGNVNNADLTHIGWCCLPEGDSCLSDDDCCYDVCAIEDGYDSGECLAVGLRHVPDPKGY